MQYCPEVIFLLFLPTRWKIEVEIQLYFCFSQKRWQCSFSCLFFNKQWNIIFDYNSFVLSWQKFYIGSPALVWPQMPMLGSWRMGGDFLPRAWFFYLSSFPDMPFHAHPILLIGEAYSQSLYNISAQEMPLFYTEEMTWAFMVLISLWSWGKTLNKGD